MLGAGLHFGHSRGDDRSYNPVKARKINQEQIRRAQSDISGVLKEEKSVTWTSKGSDESRKANAAPGDEPMLSKSSNLERFLESVIPTVPAQYLSKTMRGWRTCDVEFQPYFELGDLWESFKEWSAYGAGVPLVLNDSDCVVQYYVPYLSGIQIYGNSMKSSVKSRRPGEESDGDNFRDSSSDGSSDCELDRGLKFSREQQNYHVTSDVPLRIVGLSLTDHQEDFSSDDSESGNSRGCLLFEYLERDPPNGREPLADKISDLAFRFPELKTLRSCDLLPSSWVSVAWYPIYRIPTGPTLRDLDACFLTFHSLHTPMKGAQSEMDGVPEISLPVFGLASYKFRGSLWTPNGGRDCQLTNSLLQAADDRLRLLQVNHPDFLFFCRR